MTEISHNKSTDIKTENADYNVCFPKAQGSEETVGVRETESRKVTGSPPGSAVRDSQQQK